jgi:hypothetical protein
MIKATKFTIESSNPIEPFVHMFCEDNKLPWWGGLRHIVNVAILSFFLMVKEKEKLALFINLVG